MSDRTPLPENDPIAGVARTRASPSPESSCCTKSIIAVFTLLTYSTKNHPFWTLAEVLANYSP
jgi:hypothetical protein